MLTKRPQHLKIIWEGEAVPDASARLTAAFAMLFREDEVFLDSDAVKYNDY